MRRTISFSLFPLLFDHSRWTYRDHPCWKDLLQYNLKYCRPWFYASTQLLLTWSSYHWIVHFGLTWILFGILGQIYSQINYGNLYLQCFCRCCPVEHYHSIPLTRPTLPSENSLFIYPVTSNLPNRISLWYCHSDSFWPVKYSANCCQSLRIVKWWICSHGEQVVFEFVNNKMENLRELLITISVFYPSVKCFLYSSGVCAGGFQAKTIKNRILGATTRKKENCLHLISNLYKPCRL